MLTYEALARDVDADDLIARILATVPAQPLTSRNHDEAPRPGPNGATGSAAAPDGDGSAAGIARSWTAPSHDQVGG
jgi:hypothetical protein